VLKDISTQKHFNFVGLSLFPSRGRKRCKIVDHLTPKAAVVGLSLFPSRGRKRWLLQLEHLLLQEHVGLSLFPSRGRKHPPQLGQDIIDDIQGWPKPIPLTGTETLANKGY